MEKLKDIIRNNRMSTRPEYYSGRGATLSDLDSKILQGIYLGIEKEFGLKAAKNYVKMVVGIKVLSATTFLNELYSLFYNNWKYKTKKTDESGIAIQKDKNGEYNATHGMLSMFEAMHNQRDDTMAIKGQFCYTHKIKAKVVFDEYSADGLRTACYYY